MAPSLSLAQSGSGQGGNRSVPKKEREIHGVDFRVLNLLFLSGRDVSHMKDLVRARR